MEELMHGVQSQTQILKASDKKAAGRESCDKQLAQRVQVRLVPRRASYKRRQKKIKADSCIKS